MLLQLGADPRLYAEDGLTPSQQSSFENVRNVLDSWDIALTDRLLQKLQADQEKQQADDRQMAEVETQQLETQLVAAEKEYATVEKQVDCLRIPLSYSYLYVGVLMCFYSLRVSWSVCSRGSVVGQVHDFIFRIGQISTEQQISVSTVDLRSHPCLSPPTRMSSKQC